MSVTMSTARLRPKRRISIKDILLKEKLLSILQTILASERLLRWVVGMWPKTLPNFLKLFIRFSVSNLQTEIWRFHRRVAYVIDRTSKMKRFFLAKGHAVGRGVSVTRIYIIIQSFHKFVVSLLSNHSRYEGGTMQIICGSSGHRLKLSLGRLLRSLAVWLRAGSNKNESW